MPTAVTSSSLAGTSDAFDAARSARAVLASREALAAVFDHTLLKPEATQNQIVGLCEDAARYRFACAMVNPAWVALAVSVLAGTVVAVGTVVGFPLGASLTTTKRQETNSLVALGATEIDMVLDIGALKSGNYQRVAADLGGVIEVCRDAAVSSKVILETFLLTAEEKILAARIAFDAGADFLKTSTGFAGGGATAADVALLRGVAGTRCGVKASGGIRTLADACAMLEAGASRIGASASVAILKDFAEKS